MDKSLIKELDELLYVVIEDTASDEQIERLNGLMESSSEVQQYVADYYYIAAALRKSNLIALASLGTENELNELNYLLHEMAEHEVVAPTAEVEVEQPQSAPKRDLKDVPVVRARRKMSPHFVAMKIAALAAIFVLIAYLYITPPETPIAVLTDSIGAEWHEPQDNIQNESLVFYSKDAPRILKKGIVEIEFDSGASVVVEGPSEFVCKSSNQVALTFGRLYARVPSEAIGFTVETAHSQVVDLGTEFGVQVNVDGSMEMHVTKGLTKLLLGGEITGKDTFAVKEGQAREVSSDGESVREICLKENTFVQRIHSETGLVWKGRNTVDLADIVGGGNGFGTGRRNIGVNPITGKITDIFQQDINRKADNTYHGVGESPLIDGVFVPNGQTKQVVSSQGDVFSQCPVTQGNFFTEISSSPVTINRAELVLGGVNYSRSDVSSLFLHANLGVTYDLKAIRSQLAGIRVTRFRSTIGICESSRRPCNADFWILVDGQLRYSREKVQQKGILDTVEIELSENDRFLTLITTDGGDPDISEDRGVSVTSMDSDWCLFAEPVLVLE